MSDLIGGGSTIPVAHNAAEGGSRADGTNSLFGVARNANDFRNVTVNNEPITPTASAGQLSAVFVQEINLPSMCQVVYSVDEHWTKADFNQFVIGEKLKFSDPALQVGGSGVGLPTMYISGMTFEARPESGVQSVLTVVAFDKMHWLRFGTRTAPPFVDQTDKQIFESVLSLVPGLTLSADEMPDDKRYPYVLQDNESSYDFLMRRCEEGNYECLVEVQGGAEKFVVRPCAEGKDPPSNLALVYRQDIESISLDLRVPTAGSPATAWGYDVKTGEWVSGTYEKDEERDEMKGLAPGFRYTRAFAASVPMTLRRPDLIDKATLEYAARAARTRRQNVFIEGTATLRDINLKTVAGVNVALKGVSPFFDGRYYIHKSTHERDRQGGRTILGLRRSGL